MAPGEERGDEGAASAQRDSRPDVGVRLSGPAEAPAEDWGRHGERRGTGEPAAGALGRERLASDDCGALAAARGANADTDVLRVGGWKGEKPDPGPARLWLEHRQCTCLPCTLHAGTLLLVSSS